MHYLLLPTGIEIPLSDDSIKSRIAPSGLKTYAQGKGRGVVVVLLWHDARIQGSIIVSDTIRKAVRLSPEVQSFSSYTRVRIPILRSSAHPFPWETLQRGPSYVRVKPCITYLTLATPQDHMLANKTSKQGSKNGFVRQNDTLYDTLYPSNLLRRERRNRLVRGPGLGQQRPMHSFYRAFKQKPR